MLPSGLRLVCIRQTGQRRLCIPQPPDGPLLLTASAPGGLCLWRSVSHRKAENSLNEPYIKEKKTCGSVCGSRKSFFFTRFIFPQHSISHQRTDIVFLQFFFIGFRRIQALYLYLLNQALYLHLLNQMSNHRVPHPQSMSS